MYKSEPIEKLFAGSQTYKDQSSIKGISVLPLRLFI